MNPSLSHVFLPSGQHHRMEPHQHHRICGSVNAVQTSAEDQSESTINKRFAKVWWSLWRIDSASQRGWPSTRESFSEFNHQSRNFQHSLSLGFYSWDVTARPKIKETKMERMNGCWTWMESHAKTLSIILSFRFHPTLVVQHWGLKGKAGSYLKCTKE